jgi:hypothetical protein
MNPIRLRHCLCLLFLATAFNGGAEPAPAQRLTAPGKSDNLPAAGTVMQAEVVLETIAKVKRRSGERTTEAAFENLVTQVRTVEGLGGGRYRVIELKSEEEGYMTIAGKKQKGPPPPTPLKGVPIIIEKKNGGWVATLEKGEPSAAQAEALARFTAKVSELLSAAIYGEEPRRPGDQWKADPAQSGLFGPAYDLKGDFSMAFVEVKEIQGSSCAVLKATFNVSGMEPGSKSRPPAKVTYKGNATIHRSLADFVNLQVEFKSAATSLTESPNGSMLFEGPFNVTAKYSIAKP